MTFLPIVDRELRVAARRRGTYWLRFFAALAVITIALCLLLTAPSSVPAFRIGKLMFGFQSALAFGFCLLAGVFLTADTLSAEKREGTLGLLFLTDLKGVDVVLGKLVASSIQSVYALLAVLPILALPLLMGGVTAGEFWRINLALVTTLLFSLVVGIVASSLGLESRQTMVMSLAVLVAVAGVLPALAWLEQVTLGRPAVQDYWLLPSPVGALTGAFDVTYRTSRGWMFWASVGTLWSLCLTGLAVASLLLPRTWQEGKRAIARRERPSVWQRIRFRDARRRTRWRLKLSENPFLWLAGRDRMPNVLAWVSICLLGLLWLGFFLAIFVRTGGSAQQRSSFIVSMFVALGTHIVFKAIVAMEASRRFSDDRSSGALELLLVSPLSPFDIVRGQRAALRRHFLKPMFLLSLVNVLFFWMAVGPDPLSFGGNDAAIFGRIFFGGGVLLFVDVWALGWVGMLAGLRSRRHTRAVASTLARLMLPAWRGLSAIFMAGAAGRILNQEAVSNLISAWFIFSGAYSIVMAVSAKRQLLGRFLRLAVESPSRARLSCARPVPPLLHFRSVPTGSMS